jgi:hypothetical protein
MGICDSTAYNDDSMTIRKVPLQSVVVRLDDATIARIDALRPVFSTTARDATCSDVLREVIVRGLERFECDPQGTLRELMRFE